MCKLSKISRVKDGWVRGPTLKRKIQTVVQTVSCVKEEGAME
jgi:hypothetical protein